MAIYYLGSLYIDKGDLEKASEYFEKAIAQKPNFDAAYFNLGMISEMNNKLKEAEEYYNKTIE